MKDKFKYGYLISWMMIGCMFGCDKQELPFYEAGAGVYFDGGKWNFTFRDAPGKSLDTIGIPVLIAGDSVSYDREFLAEVVEDTNTTAPAGLYEILSGKVEKGKFGGILPVVVKNPESGILNDTIFDVKIKLVASRDFTEVRLGGGAYIVSFTNKIIQPANWSWLRYYFGSYSTVWWGKIMEWTGRTSLPYYPTHPDQEVWNMSVGEVKAFQAMVKVKLEEYNASPEGPLIHDDGDKKGQLVVMP